MIICSAKALSLAAPLAATSLLDSISSMSLLAASVTKSWVDGLMPRVELTPIFSGTDCATTGVAKERATTAVARILCIKAAFRLCTFSQASSECGQSARATRASAETLPMGARRP